jgi:hypothetical protein
MMIGIADSSRSRRASAIPSSDQLEVQHDEIDHFISERPLHCAPVSDGCDAELVLAEIVSNCLADYGIVVDGEDMRRRSL